MGFIGNININSDGGNINISGVDAEMVFVEEAVESVDAAGASGLAVVNPVGNVSVKATEGSKVDLVKKLYLPKACTEDEKTRIREIFQQAVLGLAGDVVEIKVPQIPVLNVMSARVDLEIQAPKQLGFQQAPGVNDIKLDGLEGDVKLQNNVGNLELMNLAGKLQVHTNSGTIKGHMLKNILSVTANAGSIALSSLEIPAGEVKIISQVGNVEVDINQVDPAALCEVKSNTGSASALFARDINVTLEAKTSMGQLDVDPNITVTTRGNAFMGGAISGVINQSGGKVSVSSNTGQVSVKLK